MKSLLSIILSTLIAMSAYAQAVDWPVCAGNLRTDQINATMDSYGQFLRPDVACTGNCPETSPDCLALESPAGSGITYLYAGGIWIGGIVNGDTLVSASRDNTFPPSDEMRPARTDGRGIYQIATPGDFALRAELYDTATAGVMVDPASGRPHVPLHLRIALRAHVRDDADFGRAVIYDMVVTNIGNDTIREGFVGIYLDPDITGAEYYGYDDDMVGSLRSSGIGYAVDNDGDPGFTDFTAQSPTRLIALKFLQSSFESDNRNFNWWRGNFYGSALGDFGPRRRDTVYHDFGTGSTGEPLGDRNKYLMMSFPEWDYDQCYVHTIGPDNDRWLEPPAGIATDLYDGGDIRFLMSIGSFNLSPDSSVRVLFAIFTGRFVHRDPAVMQFLPDYPDLYRQSLYMNDVVATAEHAQMFAEELVNPSLPPAGLAAVHQSDDSVTIAWDPWGFDDVTGFNINIGSVSLDNLPYPGALPPWLGPDSLPRRLSGRPGWSLTLPDLRPDSFYFVTVGHQSDSGPGATCEPIAVRPWERPPSPTFDADRFLFTDGDPAVLAWAADSGHVDHFNIYRFSNHAEALDCFHAFYDTDRAADGRMPSDSFTVKDTTYYYFAMQPYALVDGAARTFEDAGSCDGCYYVVSAVDQFGFESWFSSPALTLQRPAQSAEVGVLTFSSYYGQGTVSSVVEEVYDSVLSEYTHEIRFLYLPENQFDSALWWRELMKYELVIIDDGFDDYAITMIPGSAIATYLEEGGQVVYAGSFFRKTDANRLTADPRYRAVDSTTRSLFGVDSVFQIGLRWYYENTDIPLVDSLLGFICAEPEREDLRPICYDSAGQRFLSVVEDYWPHASAPFPSTFRPTGSADVLYRFRSLTPQTSLVHDDPTAVMVEHGEGRAIAFGEHLWYMDTSDVRAFINWVMERTPTGIADPQLQVRPERLWLAANYPNPFNPTTTIEFSLPSAADVLIEVYNILGQRVTRLHRGRLSAGDHSVIWDGRTDSGSPAASGVYFYRLTTDSEHVSRKMLLIR